MEDNKNDSKKETLDQEEKINQDDVLNQEENDQNLDASQDEQKTETSSEQSNETSDDNKDGKQEKNDRKFRKAEKKSDKMQEKIDVLEDMVKRQLAEFENYRRRTENEKSSMFEAGAKSVIEKILPIIDNFERGLTTIPEEDQGKPFADGMNMIYKQLMGEMERIGVKPIVTEGQEFNPNFHNAVMQVQNDEMESGMIAQELQKGYTYNDTVVRHSMVAVVQ